MTAYYNEFDPKAAAWLRELIKRGLIADGEVDERDLWDVAPADLDGFEQVHLCAGIGVWSYAARRAGWPDDRPVWTASFPCQPFSAAGKGKGFADERHLWPAGLHLIRECRPAIVFGEQVSSKDGLAWLDLVQADLEGEGYAVGALDTCAAGVGAPHIRQRLYWSAERLVDDDDAGLSQRVGLAGVPGRESSAPEGQAAFGRGIRSTVELADDTEQGRLSRGWAAGSSDGRDETRVEPGRLRDAGGLALADDAEWRADTTGGHDSDGQDTGRAQGASHAQGRSGYGDPGPTNGLWRDADWLLCRDGKWRPVEPGTFPLAHGAAARVGRLRGYGNAIVAEAATQFIEAYLDGKTINAEAPLQLR